MPEATAPLAGITVIDLTRYLAGPFCTQILGDFGAEVLKIEPVIGARAEMGGYSGRDSYFFMSTNRSKKSVQIDVRHPAGRDVVLRLVDHADVVIDNFRPGVMEAMGLGHDALAARNPRIITCSVSGFGASGPMRDFPGFDQIAQGFSGLMSVTGTEESGPLRVGIAICDLLGGIFAAQGILLALHARARSGRGQRVETSLLEAIVSVLTWSAGIYFDTGRTPSPAGNHHPLSAPHGVHVAADRPFNIACGNDAMWRMLAEVIGRPELVSDPRFDSLGHRIKNRAALTAEINHALAAYPADHWIELFNLSGIPAGPILTIEEMFNHPQTAAREMLLRLAHPVHGEIKTTGLGVKLSATPGRVGRPPLLGEHTAEVLAAAGFSADELARLRAAKAIG
ncbi:MAG TPA: CoA transferase [Candidatus Binataceae bacterium]|nr:CoA transferase [Candidatus Binataceae bacterium]